MKDPRRDAHRPQRAKTSDAEQQLLTDADAPVTSVQTRSQFTIFGCIPYDIRIQKKQVAAPYFQAPDSCVDQAAAGFDLYQHGLAIRIDSELHRQFINIGFEIFLLLPAVAVQPLPEISLTIKQADADQWNSEIGCALDVVAGQHAQSAGINRNRFMQAEFSREI